MPNNYFNKYINIHISKIINFILRFNIILLAIFFLINSTSPFVYLFEIHKIGSFSNIADNWINYLLVSFFIFNSIFLILKNKRLVIPYYFFFIILYLFCLFVSAFLSENFNSYVIWEIASLAVGILFFLSLYQNSFNNKNINLFFWILFFSGFVNSIISVFQIYSFEILNISFDVLKPPSGGFFHKNKLASFLATTQLCPLFILIRFDKDTNYKNILNFNFKKFIPIGLITIIFLLSILNLYVLKLTASLTGLIGFSTGLLICAIWRFIGVQTKTKYLVPIIPFIIISCSTLYYKELNNYFTKELNATTLVLNKITQHGTIDKRIDLYKACTEIFLEKPFFGHGLGTFKEIFQEKRVYANQGKVINKVEVDKKLWLHPHNEFLYRLIESGLLGGIGLMSLAFSFIFIVIFKNRLDALKYFALIFPLTLHLQTETPFHHNEISWFLYILILYLSMKKSCFIVDLSKVFDFKIVFILFFVLVFLQSTITFWLIDKSYLSRNASKAFHLINSRINNPDLFKLLEKHINDSYYKPLAHYILLLHKRKYWILNTDNEFLLTKFVEESENNHSWLPSKNLPLLKAIALSKLNRIEEAKLQLHQSRLRFPYNPNNKDAESIIKKFTIKYNEKL